MELLHIIQQKQGAQCWGIDYSESSIEVAKQLADHFKVKDRVTYIARDATKEPPFSDSFFDKLLLLILLNILLINKKFL